MIDLNDLRTFEKVAAASSFSRAARALGMPKSTVSRGVARLEQALGVRLFQRTTRDVLLTPAGEVLRARCAELMTGIDAAVDAVGGLAGEPRGLLRISVGIGFGINVLSRHLPEFLRRFPAVDVALDLTSREADLVPDAVDVAVRMGPLPDSALVATRLGRLSRFLCAAPSYLERRGRPSSPQDLASHDCVEMPSRSGRARTWTFSRGGETVSVGLEPRVSINDAITIHQLLRNGAGVGIVSGHLCRPDFAAGGLVHLCPEWSAPPVEVTVLYPSRRELSPLVRAFVDFLREATRESERWQGYLPVGASPPSGGPDGPARGDEENAARPGR